jgi:hypothetical protein
VNGRKLGAKCAPHTIVRVRRAKLELLGIAACRFANADGAFFEDRADAIHDLYVAAREYARVALKEVG